MKSININMILIVVVANCVHTHHHLLLLDKLLQSNHNIFNETDKTVHQIMYKMFDILNISALFFNQPRLQLLLKMNNNFHNFAISTFDMYYNVLRNITLIEVDKSVNKTEPNQSIERKAYEEDNVMQSFYADEELVTGASNEVTPFYRRRLRVVQGVTGLMKLPTSKEDVKVKRRFDEKPSSIQKYPFIVSIHIRGEFTCAGSIISQDFIITAASCLQIHYNNNLVRKNPRITKVRVGSDWISREGKMLQLSAIYFYPKYDSINLHHNLALMRLKASLNFESHRRPKVNKIQLPTGNSALDSNKTVIVLGWGAKKLNEIVNYSEKLSFFHLDLYPLNKCKNIYTSDYVTNNHFCAGFKSTGGGACNKDVGGTGVIDGVLVGMVSFGSPVCGAKDLPTVFTRVDRYRGWIKSIMEKHSLKVQQTIPSKTLKKQMLRSTQPEQPPVEPTADVEVKILHDILHELNKGKYNLISDILYDDKYFADLFKVSEEKTIIQHPLFNKSVSLLMPLDIYTTIAPPPTEEAVSPTFEFTDHPITMPTVEIIPEPESRTEAVASSELPTEITVGTSLSTLSTATSEPAAEEEVNSQPDVTSDAEATVLRILSKLDASESDVSFSDDFESISTDYEEDSGLIDTGRTRLKIRKH